MGLRLVRKASSTISGGQAGQDATGTVSKKTGRLRKKKTEEQSQPHPPRVAKELEESERLSGACKGTMRETVGKGKVQVVPIAILPNKHETPPPQNFQLGTKIRADYETICKTRRLKGKRVFTNENFIADSFESQTLDSWAGPGEVEALTSNADPGSRKLVRYLVSEVGVAKKSAEQYLNSAPSILGTSMEQLRGVVKDLEGLGFSRGQVAQILPQFPCSVAVDWGNLREVFVFLNEEVRMAEAQVLSLLKRHPFIFTLPCSQVRQCLSKLQNLNLNSREIANILNHTPLLACVPLSDQSVDTIETFLLYCMNTSSVQPMLFHTIFHHPSQVQLTGHTSLLTALLHTYQADSQKVLSKLPLFFQQDADRLEMVIKMLCGSPLYFDPADIATLLETVPGALCSIADKKLLKKHLSELCKLFTSPVSARLKIRKYADLLNPECSVKTKYRVLTKLGFSFTQAASVLCERPGLLTQHLQQEFVHRLQTETRTACGRWPRSCVRQAVRSDIVGSCTVVSDISRGHH